MPNAIHCGVTYGYEIVRRLREVDSVVITEGTVYPILSRLKREEFVQTAIEESPGGPPRKVYRITDKGRRQLEAMNHYWRRVEAGIDAIQRSPTAHSGGKGAYCPHVKYSPFPSADRSM